MKRRVGVGEAMVGKVKRKGPPYPFVLEALAAVEPEVKRMFSGFAVYRGDLLVMMLRESEKQARDNGIWLVLSETASVELKDWRGEFPSLRKIGLLGGAIQHWLLIPADGVGFEGEALRACELILRRDVRLGRVPESRRRRG